MAAKAVKTQKNKVGRPRKEIDLDMLKNMVRIQCTAEECGNVLDVSVDTLDRRLKEEGYENFADFYKMFADEGKVSLRRLQWKSAQGSGRIPPSVTMQIWLGKQMLGQQDRRELTGADGGPVKTETTVTHKRYEEMSLEELQAEANARSAGS